MHTTNNSAAQITVINLRRETAAGGSVLDCAEVGRPARADIEAGRVSDGAAVNTIRADELRPGDDIVVGGQSRRRITHIECRSGWSFPIAFSDDGWAIALGDQLLVVDRPA